MTIPSLKTIWRPVLCAALLQTAATGAALAQTRVTPIYGKTELSAHGAQDHVGKIRRAIPQQRFGQPEDIAAVATFLTSDEANFVTGSEYGIDGGFGA